MKESVKIVYEKGEELRVTVLETVKIDKEGEIRGDRYETIPVVSLVPAKLNSLCAACWFYDIQKYPDEEFTVIISGKHGRWEVLLDGTDGLMFIIGCVYRKYHRFLSEILKQFGISTYTVNNKYQKVSFEEIDKDVWKYDILLQNCDKYRRFGVIGDMFMLYIKSLAENPYMCGNIDLNRRTLKKLNSIRLDVLDRSLISTVNKMKKILCFFKK